MDIVLKPHAQKFIEDQVKAGRFRNAAELVDEAVNRLILETEDDLDDETAAAINRAEDQIDRGEAMNFEEFAKEVRKRMAAPRT